MKQKLTMLFIAGILPVFMFSQSFNLPDLKQSDYHFFLKELEKRSVVIQTMYAKAEMKAEIDPEHARSLVDSKLRELNNEELNRLYASIPPDQITQIGIVLYLMMNGLANTPDGYDGQSKFGAAIGLFMMFTIAKFILMPELTFMLRKYGEKSSFGSSTATFTQIALALTFMYIIEATTINFLVGIAPMIGVMLSGKYKDDDGNEGDIEIGDNGANRMFLGMGFTAGVLLSNYIMLRLIYNTGLSKLFDGQDAKMYFLAIALSVPFSAFQGGK